MRAIKKVEDSASDARAIKRLALGAAAVGALAVGAGAIGALAVGSLVVGRARFRKVHIEELTVGRLRVLQQESEALR